MDLWIASKLLALLVAANGAPIIVRNLFGHRGAAPIDGGWRLPDGKPLFGSSKTWRGLCSALLAGAALAPLLALPYALGLTVAAAAMAGDLLSSFIKRRLGIPPSGMAFGLDQVPESLLPLAAIAPRLGLTFTDVLQLTAAFLVIELLLSQALYRLHIRQRPY